MATMRPAAARDARRVLAPAAGRRAQIHAADAGPQQPLALLDFLELEDRARAPAFGLGALDELVAGMLGEPPGAALGTLRHDVPLAAYNAPRCTFRKSKRSTCAAWRTRCTRS